MAGRNLLFGIWQEIKKILTKIKNFSSLPLILHLPLISRQVGLLNPAHSIGS
jgi:hypothetical protein